MEGLPSTTPLQDLRAPAPGYPLSPPLPHGQAPLRQSHVGEGDPEESKPSVSSTSQRLLPLLTAWTRERARRISSCLTSKAKRNRESERQSFSNSVELFCLHLES